MFEGIFDYIDTLVNRNMCLTIGIPVISFCNKYATTIILTFSYLFKDHEIFVHYIISRDQIRSKILFNTVSVLKNQNFLVFFIIIQEYALILENSPLISLFYNVRILVPKLDLVTFFFLGLAHLFFSFL